MFLKLIDKFSWWHDTAWKEILSHPISITLYLERIERRFVAESVNKKLSVWFKPIWDFFKNLFPISQMFEHLDRNNAIILGFFGVEIIYIACYDIKIFKPHIQCFFHNIFLLSLRIRNSSDRRIRVLFG